jgi:NAD(P)-dependent dehydrogenase (short-subunit alcohol dehydrogenase family)
MDQPHALAVGTSGMLAAACHGLADRGWQVTMIARTERRLVAVAAGRPGVWPVPVDYRDAGAFGRALAPAAGQRGGFTLALCWIRGNAPEALRAAAAAVVAGGRVVHVLGSASRDPTTAGSAALREQDRVRYQPVVLGFVVEGGRSRWLTDAEISAGVLAAIDDPAAEPYVVGRVHPWSARP